MKRPFVERWRIDMLPPELRCEFEERAGMRQFEGYQAKEVAEEEAYHEVVGRPKVIVASKVEQLGMFNNRGAA